MTALILDFVKNHWLGVVVGILVAVALGTIEVQHLEIEHLNSKITVLKADNDTLTRNNAVLTGAIDTQNAAVTALQAQADVKQKAAATALAKAVQKAQTYQNRWQAIRDQKLTGDDCQNMKSTVDLYFSKAAP